MSTSRQDKDFSKMYVNDPDRGRNSPYSSQQHVPQAYKNGLPGYGGQPQTMGASGDSRQQPKPYQAYSDTYDHLPQSPSPPPPPYTTLDRAAANPAAPQRTVNIEIQRGSGYNEQPRSYAPVSYTSGTYTATTGASYAPSSQAYVNSSLYNSPRSDYSTSGSNVQVQVKGGGGVYSGGSINPGAGRGAEAAAGYRQTPPAGAYHQSAASSQPLSAGISSRLVYTAPTLAAGAQGYSNSHPVNPDGSTPIPVSNIQRGKPPSQAPGVNGAAAAGVVTKMKDPRPYQLRPMLDSVGKGSCLQGCAFFAMEGRPYCEQCYMNTLEKCTVCSKPITDRILRATGHPYHACFCCVACGCSLDGVPFTVDAAGKIHCIKDFRK